MTTGTTQETPARGRPTCDDADRYERWPPAGVGRPSVGRSCWPPTPNSTGGHARWLWSTALAAACSRHGNDDGGSPAGVRPVKLSAASAARITGRPFGVDVPGRDAGWSTPLLRSYGRSMRLLGRAPTRAAACTVRFVRVRGHARPEGGLLNWRSTSSAPRGNQPAGRVVADSARRSLAAYVGLFELVDEHGLIDVTSERVAEELEASRMSWLHYREVLKRPAWFESHRCTGSSTSASVDDVDQAEPPIWRSAPAAPTSSPGSTTTNCRVYLDPVGHPLLPLLGLIRTA